MYLLATWLLIQVLALVELCLAAPQFVSFFSIYQTRLNSDFFCAIYTVRALGVRYVC